MITLLSLLTALAVGLAVIVGTVEALEFFLEDHDDFAA